MFDEQRPIVVVACVFAAIAALASCSPPPADDASPTRSVPPEALERARGAARALTGELVQTLVQELQSGGAVAAVEVCSSRAQEIVSSHSEAGLTVRRVSLKVRNPLDLPDPYEFAKLQELEAELAEGRMPEEHYEVVDEAGHKLLRYLKPIVVQETCLRCHGMPDDIDPAVGALLEERYPSDEAAGYRAGDFRGAVSVTVELERDSTPGDS